MSGPVSERRYLGEFNVVLQNTFLTVRAEATPQTGNKIRSSSAPPSLSIIPELQASIFQDIIRPTSSHSCPAAQDPGANASDTSSVSKQWSSTSVDTPTPVPLSKETMLMLHRTGRCHPCRFYRFKSQGCRFGDECSRCHLCGAKEARRRQVDRRKERRMEGERASSSRSGTQTSEFPEFGQMPSAEELPLDFLEAASASGPASSTERPAPQMTPRQEEHQERLLARHRAGACHPCRFFRFKHHGCKYGFDCERCHVCTAKEARERQKQRRREDQRAIEVGSAVVPIQPEVLPLTQLDVLEGSPQFNPDEMQTWSL